MSSAVARACAGALLLAVVAFAASGGSAPGASSSVTVTMDVTSHTAITNECRSTAAWNLGTVLPGVPATTSTGSDVCRVRFTSSNDTAALRMYQADREGTAMARLGTTWTRRAGTERTLLAVDGTSDGRVIAVGQQGVVRASSDSGASFPVGGAGTASQWNSMNDVDIVDASSQYAWAVGHMGTVLRTTDGGSSWTAQVAGFTSHIYSVLAIDTLTAVAADSNDVRRTTNGGSSWTSLGLGLPSTPQDMAMRSSTDMVMVGNSNLVRRSTDGGITWPAVAGTPSWSHWYGVDLAGTSTIWIAGSVGGRAAVARSTDHGATWEHRSTWMGETVEDIVALSETEALVVGRRGTVLHTSDSGATWQRRTPPTTETLMGLTRAGGGQLVATTMNERILRTVDGSAWTTTFAGTSTEPVLSDVAAHPSDRRVVVAVGDGGTVRRSADRGATWATVASGTSAHLRAVTLADDGYGWAVGHGGTILRTADAGSSWTTQSSPVTDDLYDVAALSRSVAWAVGRDGRILRTQDGGGSWSVVVSGTSEQLYGVSVVDATTVWVSGSNSTVRRTTDAGANWVARNHHNGVTVWAIHATSATSASVSPEWPGFGRTTDGGSTWSDALYWGGTHALAVEAGRPIGTVSEFGSTGATQDGGTTWTSWGNPGHYVHLRAVAAIEASRVVAVGENGVISTSSSRDPINDFGAAGSTWGSATNGLFGACLQAVGTGTTGVWTADAANVPGRCEPIAGDPWNAVPVAPTTIASIATPGTDGRVDVVWGAVPKPDQPRGSYTATITFEAIAPAA